MQDNILDKQKGIIRQELKTLLAVLSKKHNKFNVLIIQN